MFDSTVYEVPDSRNVFLPPSDSSDPLYSTINNDTPNPLETTCKICGRSFQSNRNLKILTFHTNTSIKRKLNVPTPDFWPCELTADALAAKLTENLHEHAVTSTTTGETLILAGHTTCQTSNVIYLTECSKCKDQYIGKTKNPIHCLPNQLQCSFVYIYIYIYIYMYIMKYI